MKAWLSLTILLSSLVLFTSSDEVRKRKQFQDVFAEIFREFLEISRQDLAKYTFPDLEMSINRSNFQLDFTATGFQKENLENYKVAILKSISSPFQGTAEITNLTLTWDYLNVTAKCDVAGLIEMLYGTADILGNGPVSIYMRDIFLTAGGTFKVYGWELKMPKDGITDFDLRIGSTNVSLNGLGEDGDWRENVGDFFSLFVPALINDFKHDIFKFYKPHLISVINEYLFKFFQV